jgi:GT2 family glycosyltransferase
MEIVRRRVATRGQHTDGFPGLGLRAYLIRDRTAGGSPVNQYAPFYLWHDVSGMAGFSSEWRFAGHHRRLRPPAVRHWTGIALERGPARDAPPRSTPLGLA